jgi:hypothetical protein
LAHSEWFAAIVALAKAKASGLAFHLADAFGVGIAAMRANRTVRPKPALDVRKSGFLVKELRGIENGGGHV